MGEKDQLVGIAVGTPQAAGPDADTSYFNSFKYEEIEQGRQFSFHRRYGDANPYQVEILDKSLLNKPLFFIVSSPYSAPYGVAAAFTAETDTTTCPVTLLMAQMKILLGERYPDRFAGLFEIGAAEKLNALKEHKNPEPVKAFGWSHSFRGVR